MPLFINCLLPSLLVEPSRGRLGRCTNRMWQKALARCTCLMHWVASTRMRRGSGGGSTYFRQGTGLLTRVQVRCDGIMFRIRRFSGQSARRCAMGHRQARYAAYAAALVCHAPAHQWLRHSDGAGTAGTQGCGDDDDLYACAEQGRARCGEPAGPLGRRFLDCFASLAMTSLQWTLGRHVTSFLAPTE
jgi:hypothetical protein